MYISESFVIISVLEENVNMLFEKNTNFSNEEDILDKYAFCAYNERCSSREGL